jgi:hypothetical protein
VASYELAFGNDPSKALAVPLLRRDIESTQQSDKADLAAVRDEMSRNLALIEWAIGLLIASNVGLGIVTAFDRKDEKK